MSRIAEITQMLCTVLKTAEYSMHGILENMNESTESSNTFFKSLHLLVKEIHVGIANLASQAENKKI